MTEQQIAPVGPERDAQVAREIMGWTGDGKGSGCWYKDGILVDNWPWRPSTDPHCAPDVLLRMEEQNYLWSINVLFIFMNDRQHKRYICKVEGYGQGSVWRERSAEKDELADAITSAALQAKLGEAKGNA